MLHKPWPTPPLHSLITRRPACPHLHCPSGRSILSPSPTYPSHVRQPRARHLAQPLTRHSHLERRTTYTHTRDSLATRRSRQHGNLARSLHPSTRRSPSPPINASNDLRATSARSASEAALLFRQATFTRLCVRSRLRPLRVKGSHGTRAREGACGHRHQHRSPGRHVR